MNAEAEKLQFVLGTLEDTGVALSPAEVSVGDLLNLDASVQRTLRDVIKKEMLLEFKFENVLDFIGTLPAPPVTPPCNPTTGAQFSNATAITNIDGNPFGTNPYPSNIDVSGLQGSISKVTITIRDYFDPGNTSPAAGHLSLLLVSPEGTASLLMSDAGNSSLGNPTVTFTLDDNGPILIPQAPFASGTYKPSVYANDYNFDAPAPQGNPYSNTSLSAYIGENPNGTWSLYALDRHGGHGQVINGGWTLTIDTACP